MAPTSTPFTERELQLDTADTATECILEVSTASWRCQICLDEMEDEKDPATAPVTAFCGASCPAVLCRGCTAEHIRISVAAAFPGVLPKVRCPVCLIQVNKTKWRDLVSPETLTKFVEACRTACSFRTPCCENPLYTHLPGEVGTPYVPSKRRITLPELAVRTPALDAQLAALHEQTRRFCDYEISSRELIIFLETTIGSRGKLKTQHLVFDHELPTILDDERRATLLLAYHAKYDAVTTRCCGARVCFNCKRKMDGTRCACKTEGTLEGSSVVECRSCHVTMVKAEGCSAVRCWCGFSMGWTAEIHLRDRNAKGLIPVDVYDIKTHATWNDWLLAVKRVLNTQLVPRLLAQRQARVSRLLTETPSARATLAVFFQRAKWRCRFRRVVLQLRTALDAHRRTQCTRILSRQGCFVAALRRAKWRAYWARVVGALRLNRFALRYASEHPEEQRALAADEAAMLLPALV